MFSYTLFNKLYINLNIKNRFTFLALSIKVHQRYTLQLFFGCEQTTVSLIRLIHISEIMMPEFFDTVKNSDTKVSKTVIIFYFVVFSLKQVL